jgi:hypothetical protein
MILQLKQFVNEFNKPKNWLLLGNVFLVFFLIILNNLGIIPLRAGDFAFFTFLIFLFTLYRPSWAFLFFIGTIPLENINIAPEILGIAVRPYQFLAGLIIIALIIRFSFKKLNFALPKWKWFDLLPILLGIGGVLSLINAPETSISFKQAIILFSFIAIYFLTRIYLQTLDDIKKIIPFFLSSSVIVLIYGIWQNSRFLRGLNNFEIMPGRPNSTFTEADWLGIFVSLILAVLYVLIFSCHPERMQRILRFFTSFRMTSLFIFLALSFILLILTVSRSAWLGAFVSLVIFLLAIFSNFKINAREWKWKETVRIKLIIIPALIVAVGVIYIFHLTNFQLGNRIQSTGTGMQKITVSCEEDIVLPESIENVAELKQYDCRHINLEEIDSEKATGKYVSEIFRKDPNVSIRGQIYQKSWQEIKKHPILGIGWGAIGNILGQDERGAFLNSSNIFLEIWLGSGIFGLASFITLLTYILVRAINIFYLTENSSQKIFGLFLLVSWFAILIPNLFNAGIMLGFLWVWLAVAQAKN